MSLLPLLFESDWATGPAYRRRAPYEEILHPLTLVQSLLESPEYLRDFKTALQQQAGSQVTFDKKKIQANFDVQHFKPEEINVKITGDNTVTVEAKHEEKQDEHGQIYRHFVRTYVLPKNCDMNRLECKLSSDGVLNISAPIIGDQVEHKTIPIKQTGKPVRSIEEKKTEKAPQKIKK